MRSFLKIKISFLSMTLKQRLLTLPGLHWLIITTLFDIRWPTKVERQIINYELKIG